MARPRRAATAGWLCRSAGMNRFAVSSARSLFRALPAAQRTGKIAAVESAFEAVGIA